LLLKQFRTDGEGQIARRHAELVSARTLGEIANEIGLAELRIASEGAAAPTPSMLADMLEALLGAIFLDAGFTEAAATVERLWGARVAGAREMRQPAKMRLQEWAQRRGLALPAYREVSREGAEHAPTFVVEVKVAKQAPAQGSGPTKRDAETAAATALLERLDKS